MFWKIFLWFWLTVIAIGLTLVVTILSLRSADRTDERWRTEAAFYLAMYSKLAADSFEQRGRAGLQQFIDNNRFGTAGPYMFFFNEHGNELLGRTPPSRVVQLAVGLNAQAPFSAVIDGDRFVAQRVVTASGHIYELVVMVPGISVRLVLASLGARTLVILAAVLLVAGGLCFYLARHITRALVRLGEVAGQIAAGRLDTRVDPDIRRRGDEIGGLAVSFDRMAERIASLVDAQRRLLGVVSHELRSPLTRLSLTLGLLRQSTDAEKFEYLDRAELETAQLDELIGQLLTLARIDAGAELNRMEHFDLVMLVQEVAADGHFEARARGCSVDADSPISLVMLGVPEDVRRAIENPLRNAIRYTKPNSRVKIGMHQRGTGPTSVAVIQVSDQGPGVPPVWLDKIFLPFHRVEGEAGSGAGLGLAITERIVRWHGGRVRAINAPEGGLIVEMELPLVDLEGL